LLYYIRIPPHKAFTVIGPGKVNEVNAVLFPNNSASVAVFRSATLVVKAIDLVSVKFLGVPGQNLIQMVPVPHCDDIISISQVIKGNRTTPSISTISPSR
jgi:hypothetical protein